MTSPALPGCRGDKGTGTDGWKTGPLWPPCRRKLRSNRDSRTARCPAGAPSATPLGGGPRLGARDSTPPSQTQLPAGGLQLGAQMAWKVWLLLARPPVTSHRDTLAAAHAGVQVHGRLHPWGCLPLLEAPLFTHHCPRHPTPTLPPYRGLSTGSEPILPPGSSLRPPLLPAQSSGLPPRGTEEPASVHSFIHPT